jgi:hypothetical protein
VTPHQLGISPPSENRRFALWGKVALQWGFPLVTCGSWGAATQSGLTRVKTRWGLSAHRRHVLVHHVKVVSQILAVPVFCGVMAVVFHVDLWLPSRVGGLLVPTLSGLEWLTTCSLATGQVGDSGTCPGNTARHL